LFFSFSLSRVFSRIFLTSTFSDWSYSLIMFLMLAISPLKVIWSSFKSRLAFYWVSLYTSDCYGGRWDT